MRRKKLIITSGLIILFLLTWILTACSGKSPIQKYKTDLDKKDIYNQIIRIEEQKAKLLGALTSELTGEFTSEFTTGIKRTLEEMKASNESLKKSSNQISTKKDAGIASLHGYLLDYNNNNEITISRSEELVLLYEKLITTVESTEIEEIYRKMVILAKEIDNYASYANSSQTAWSEGLITMDVQKVQ